MCFIYQNKDSFEKQNTLENQPCFYVSRAPALIHLKHFIIHYQTLQTAPGNQAHCKLVRSLLIFLFAYSHPVNR